MEDRTQNLSCKNCGHILHDDDTYCGACGQSIQETKLSIKYLFFHLWNALYNLDNTIFKTLRLTHQPWKLTKAFVDGQRKSYLHPVRFYLVTIFLVAISSISLDSENIDKKREKDYNIAKVFLSERLGTLDSLSNAIQPSESQCLFIDTIEKVVFKDIKLPELDSLSEKQMGIVWINIRDKYYLTTRRDAYYGDAKKLLEKYEIDGYWNQNFFTRQLKLLRDGDAFLSFVERKILWAIFCTILFLSAFMVLFYKKSYLVEHLVFLLYFHSTYFLLFTITNFIERFDEKIWNSAFIAIILTVPFFLSYNLYNYYGNGWVMTFIKMVIFLMFYFFILLLTALAIFFLGIMTF
ncbi:MAG: DUF3667 domain-containing protein [Saprospiraceae bacterium]